MAEQSAFASFTREQLLAIIPHFDAKLLEKCADEMLEQGLPHTCSHGVVFGDIFAVACGRGKEISEKHKDECAECKRVYAIANDIVTQHRSRKQEKLDAQSTPQGKATHQFCSLVVPFGHLADYASTGRQFAYDLHAHLHECTTCQRYLELVKELEG